MEIQTDLRQYECPACETLTIVKDGERFCKCFKINHITVENWKEVFYDRIKE